MAVLLMLFCRWMRIFKVIFTLFIFSIGSSYGQILFAGEGIMDVKLGADWDQVEWELGFKGERYEKNNVRPELQFLADAAKIDFDFVVSYQHIMWLPISELFFKNDSICMIQLTSYPEYNQMLCLDIGTMEGLNFWDDSEKVTEIYGKLEQLEKDGKSFFVYKEEGLAVELFNDEVRTMLIFQPQME